MLGRKPVKRKRAIPYSGRGKDSKLTGEPDRKKNAGHSTGRKIIQADRRANQRSERRDSLCYRKGTRVLE